MLVIEAFVILGVVGGLVWLLTTLLRNRALRLEKRDEREHQIRQLTAAKELAQLLLLDEDNAIKVFQQLEKELRAKGKLPP